jgi:hypothetical protein
LERWLFSAAAQDCVADLAVYLTPRPYSYSFHFPAVNLVFQDLEGCETEIYVRFLVGLPTDPLEQATEGQCDVLGESRDLVGDVDPDVKRRSGKMTRI